MRHTCFALALLAVAAASCGSSAKPKTDDAAEATAPATPPPAPAPYDTSCTADSECVPAPSCCPEPCTANVINQKDLARAQKRVDATCDPDMPCPDAGDCVEHAYLCVDNTCKLVKAGDPQWPRGGDDETGDTAACDTLDRHECLSARHCTMDWIESSRYTCRAAKGPCEVDLLQTDRAACEARDGCAWKPADCYCPFPGYGATQVPDKQDNTGGACACGGGPPARCEAAP